MELNFHTFPNGIRLVHKQVYNTQIVHCGFALDIGSRDEKEGQEGLAHFWEHMAFKGTKKRKAFHIINRLDAVGGELNAFTTKEKIYFYASVLDQHFVKAVDLLKDITFESIFPSNQLEKERRVLLEEMSMYLDSPEDRIQDEFDELIFGDHPLGKNILGTDSSVKSFAREDFKAFIAQNLDSDRIVFSIVGNIEFKKALKVVQKHIQDLPKFSSQQSRGIFSTFSKNIKVEYTQYSQAHCMIGGEGYNLNHKNRLPLFLLNNLLGGPGMNSRLNWALREKLGYVYHVESSLQSFTDVGLFSIYFGTEKKHLQRCIQTVKKELQQLQKKTLGVSQLLKAKEQLKGQLAMAEENNCNLMLSIAKSMLDLKKVQSLSAIFLEIDQITLHELAEAASEVLDFDNLSMLQYIPSKS